MMRSSPIPRLGSFQRADCANRRFARVTVIFIKLVIGCPVKVACITAFIFTVMV